MLFGNPATDHSAERRNVWHCPRWSWKILSREKNWQTAEVRKDAPFLAMTKSSLQETVQLIAQQIKWSPRWKMKHKKLQWCVRKIFSFYTRPQRAEQARMIIKRSANDDQLISDPFICTTADQCMKYYMIGKFSDRNSLCGTHCETHMNLTFTFGDLLPENDICSFYYISCGYLHEDQFEDHF